MGGMHPRFRASADHIADLDAVVAAVRAQTGLPVWVAGVSLGSRSAASYAYQRAGSIAGVILLSSSTNPPRGIPVDAFPLHRITVPLLAIAHRDDRCPGTPPAGAQRIVAAATASPNAVMRTFTGGRNAGANACGVQTHHTFYGIEDAVVSAIVEFIASNTR
jgi:pimeloyl-ACP methyl ester carboxylesterase